MKLPLFEIRHFCIDCFSRFRIIHGKFYFHNNMYTPNSNIDFLVKIICLLLNLILI